MFRWLMKFWLRRQRNAALNLSEILREIDLDQDEFEWDNRSFVERANAALLPYGAHIEENIAKPVPGYKSPLEDWSRKFFNNPDPTVEPLTSAQVRAKYGNPHAILQREPRLTVPLTTTSRRVRENRPGL